VAHDDQVPLSCAPIRGDIAPLVAESLTVGQVDGYRIFYILLENAIAGGNTMPVEEEIWRLVVTYTEPDATWSICVAARRAGFLRLAEDAGRRPSRRAAQPLLPGLTRRG
jgi:hypothetical protein